MQQRKTVYILITIEHKIECRIKLVNIKHMVLLHLKQQQESNIDGIARCLSRLPYLQRRNLVESKRWG